jgi:hypothetical protein
MPARKQVFARDAPRLLFSCTFFRDVATTTSPAEERLLPFQDALELLTEFDKRDAQARQQPDDRIEPGSVQAALQAGQVPPVENPDIRYLIYTESPPGHEKAHRLCQRDKPVPEGPESLAGRLGAPA